MAGDAPKIKKFECPGCGANLEVRGMGQTVVMACTACGSLIDLQDDRFELIKRSTQLAFKPLIPLGTRAKFMGETLEVIGFMVRTDLSGMYGWREYLLFNPYKGFRWLVEFDGHWSFVQTVKGQPSLDGYKHFLTGGARVKFVLGEFYWRVREGDDARVVDYISPPYILSLEEDNGEQIWSEGIYVPPVEILKAFPSIPSLPYRSGIGANQPFPYGSPIELWTIAMVSLIILFFVYTTSSFRHTNTLVFSSEYSYMKTDPQREKIGTPFVLTGGTANVVVDLTAPVDNTWLEAEVSLVNADTQESYEGALEAAYYHGYDSDGSWREGSTYARIFFPEVADGNYYLTAEASADPMVNQMNYQLSVRRNVMYWPNFVVVFLLIVSIPIIVSIMKAIFEGKRWQMSDYASED